MARLDRLAPVKEVAQVGAVIGREFAHELLAAVSPPGRGRAEPTRSSSSSPRSWSSAAARRPRPSTPSSTRWSRTLPTSRCSRAAGSSSTPGSPRRSRQVTPAKVGAPPEILAHHLTEAGLLARALPAWLAAGEHAWRRSAYQEAIAHLRRGLEVASNVPGPEGKRAGNQAAQPSGCGAPMAARGPRPEVIEAYEEAGRLAAEAGETAELLRALWGSWFWN